MTTNEQCGLDRHGHRGAARRPAVESGALGARTVDPGMAPSSDTDPVPVRRPDRGEHATPIPVDDPLANLSPTAVRILTTAQHILTERGLSAVTLNAVAEESGENKALTKYYFGNKSGLIGALVDAAVHDECLASASRMQGITDEDRVERLVDELQHMSEATPSFLAFFDILPHAVRNDELRPRLATLYEWYLQLKLDWLGLDTSADVGRRAQLRPLAQLLSAVIDGLAIQALIDPERFDVHAAYAMLERILAIVLPGLLDGERGGEAAGD
jgi:AcrR family transcriptional regulator